MPRMPKSRDLDAGRQRRVGEPPRDLDAEAVVAEEDVADARDEDARAAGGAGAASSSGSTSVEREEEAVAEHARRAEVPARVVLERDRQRASRPPRPRSIASTTATRPASARSKTSPPPLGRRHDAAAAPHLDRRRTVTDSGPRRSSSSPRSRSRLRPPGRGSRRAARSSCSCGEAAAAVEDLPRARVGGAHLLRSSSVSESTLRISSSSISPPSKRSPGLSGAIRG